MPSFIDLSGARVGALNVLSLSARTGAHALWRCRCDCGGERIVRSTALHRKRVVRCASCARKEGGAKSGATRSLPDAEVRRVKDNYVQNAKRKGIAFVLSFEDIARTIRDVCFFCGAAPAGGIDRFDNAVGYTVENSVPCCSVCNYAKRTLPAEDFIAWAKRVAARHA